jgi:transcriptional regulator with XRE-family HTH domain
MVLNYGRIRQARLGADLSQDGLARKAGTSARNVARWETGRNEPRPHFVAAIAQATGKDLSFFFTEDDASDEEASDPVAGFLQALNVYIDHRQQVAA